MEKAISIRSLIGSEVRSRTNAEKIAAALADNGEVYIIDFEGVTFVSRSFADELCNMMDQNSKIRLINEDPFVKRMIDIVLAGRKRLRQREDNNDSIISFSTIDELKKFMMTL